MGPELTKTATGKVMLQRQDAKLQYKSIRQLRDNLLQRGSVQVICHRNQISESECGERKVKKILVNIGLMPRYTTEPYMGLSI